MVYLVWHGALDGGIPGSISDGATDLQLSFFLYIFPLFCIITKVDLRNT